MAMQQQWMDQQQQFNGPPPSMQDLMAEHQLQWQEHIGGSAQNLNAQPIYPNHPNHINHASAMNLNDNNNQMNQMPLMKHQYSMSATNLHAHPNNYHNQHHPNNNNNNNMHFASARQLHLHQSNSNPVLYGASAMNLNSNYHQLPNNNQPLYNPQEQYLLQISSQSHHQHSHSNMNLHSYQQLMPSHQQYSPRQMFQQNAKNNPNMYASTGHLGINRNIHVAKNHNIRSHNVINENKEESPEPEESIDHKHETFVPPAPQSKEQVEKYVNWRAKRRGVEQQMCIDLEVQRRAKIEKKRAEKEKKDNFKSKTTFSLKRNNKMSGSKTIIFESALYKKGKINKSMQLRYCIANVNRNLIYYKRSGDKVAAGNINLSEVTKISMYLPNMLSSKKEVWVELNKIKSDGLCPMNINAVALKGNKNDFGFELCTEQRIWIFTSSESEIFVKWIKVLKDLCFGKSAHSGYLTKANTKHKSWKHRFFVIYDLKEMRYFTDDTMAEQKGKVDLKKVTKIESVENESAYKYSCCIELYTPKRIWVLSAANEQDRQDWIRIIQYIKNQT